MKRVILLGISMMHEPSLVPASVEQYNVNACLPSAQTGKTTDAIRRFLAFTLYILANFKNLCFTKKHQVFDACFYFNPIQLNQVARHASEPRQNLLGLMPIGAEHSTFLSNNI
jgi:hypothetical protein